MAWGSPSALASPTQEAIDSRSLGNDVSEQTPSSDHALVTLADGHGASAADDDASGDTESLQRSATRMAGRICFLRTRNALTTSWAMPTGDVHQTTVYPPSTR